MENACHRSIISSSENPLAYILPKFIPLYIQKQKMNLAELKREIETAAERLTKVGEYL